MILKTIDSLSRLDCCKGLKKLVKPILKFLCKSKCIRYYVNKYSSEYIYGTLLDLVHACAINNINDIKINNIELSYKIEEAERNIIDMTIVFIDKNDNRNVLQVSLFGYGKIDFELSTPQYNCICKYADGKFECNDGIKFEIGSIIISAVVEILNYIFDLTPKYKYTLR